MNAQDIRYKIKNEIDEKPKIRILILWFLFSVAGVMFIKTVVRPGHIQLSESFDFYQGILPNFFAGAMFFVMVFVYYAAISIKQNAKWRRILFAFLVSFFGLTLWEVVQYFMGCPIDYYDILMTAFGNLVTVVIVLGVGIK